jgi:hypothetical protein
MILVIAVVHVHLTAAEVHLLIYMIAGILLVVVAVGVYQ